LVAVCVLLFAACGGDEDGTEAGGGETPAAEEEPQEEAEATIEVADASLGEILADADGNTLYMFVPDEEQNGEPTCYDDCAEAWPALEVEGEVVAGEGLDQSLLGSVERTDGATQVTYNDLPLYVFSGDEAVGDVNGQGLGDVWWVMDASGEPIRKTAGRY
jgi:predicted lipoprotein with Yx(FWY)xxD motif